MVGSLSPEVLQAWEHSCIHYFQVKAIAAGVQVRMVSYELKDSRIEAWIIANETRLEALTFVAFMDEVRSLWLEDGWEDILRRRILGVWQGTKPFKEWLVKIVPWYPHPYAYPHSLTIALI
jgi:hypothetical protein